jgi:hypothetical protein
MLARRRSLLAILAVVALLVPAVRAAAEPEPLPTSEELHKLFTDAQYQPLLNKLARVLQLKGPAAKPYDRVDLELLRADALLQLKQSSSAIAATSEAEKAITDSTDEKLAARARATALLFKRMQTYTFTPKFPPKGQPAPAPIDMLDLTKRKDAFTALLGDVQTEVTAKVKTAKSAKVLPPIVDAVRAAGELRAVELTAEQPTDPSAQMADELAAQAKDLIGDSVGKMDKQAKAIDDDANQWSQTVTPPQNTRTGTGITSRSGNTGPGLAQTYYKKKGLTTQETKDLKTIIDTCEKIGAVCRDFEQVSKSAAAGFKTIADATAKVEKAATTTLNADYSALRSTPPGK